MDAQKELIAIEVIRTLYTQFGKFPGDEINNRNAPFHEAFLNAFSAKLEGKVVSIPVFISLASWMHGLNTSLGQSFLEKTAHVLCNDEKKEFTANKRTGLKISTNQKSIVNGIITDLTNGNRMPNLDEENEECLFLETPNIDATDFIADVYFQDNEQVVCIELKTVKPNKGVFKVEKEKVLEAKIALKNVYPDKIIRYFLGFPFDPLSDTPTGYDKQRFMDYCVGFRKYFAENEFLLSSELWDFLSGGADTMQQLIDIINRIATPQFAEKYEFLNNSTNKTTGKNDYIQYLIEWNLISEIVLINNETTISQKVKNNNRLTRKFNQSIFKDGVYNVERMIELRSLIV
ncbi:MAG: TdeIII family type II restriction endonuclease [Candidatus Brocadia sp.]|nr:TdeIII family type II restriction endonuclease [Candidatus Brocadia sp.]